jgi:hypothetical protein
VALFKSECLDEGEFLAGAFLGKFPIVQKLLRSGMPAFRSRRTAPEDARILGRGLRQVNATRSCDARPLMCRVQVFPRIRRI